MKQEVQKALYALHSWSGLALGLLIYVLSLSGVVALFHAELQPWQRGVEPVMPASLAGVDRLLSDQGSTHPEITVLLPTAERPWAVVEMGHESGRVLQVDAASGQPLPDPGTAILDLIVRLHTDLLLPAPAGRYLVGVLGAGMLALVISGIVLHRKFLREFFTLRVRRSPRLRWTDLHKSVGLWALPFHFIMAFTGMLLGLLGLVLLLAGLVAYRGDIATAQETLFPPPPVASGEPATMRPLGELLARARAVLPGLEPEVVTVHHHGDRAARLEVYGNVPGRLVYYPMVALSPASGEILEVVDWSRDSVARRLYAMITPLHYGSFGGLLIKLLYTVLGAGSCFLVISGLRIWLARPLADAARRPRWVWWSMDAVTAGLPFALVGLLAAGRLFPILNTRPLWTLQTFLAFWFVTGLWAWWRRGRGAARELVLASGVVLMATMLIDWLLSAGHGGAWLNVVRLIGLGAGLGCVAASLSSR